MVNIRQRLARHLLVGLDTSVWIYHFEGHPRYAKLVRTVLEAVKTGQPQAIVSVVTLMELTVRSYRLNQPVVANHYEAVLRRFPNTRLVDTTPTVARRAAQLRATYSLLPADALQVATSIVAGATAWITNDQALRRLAPVIEIIVLDDLLERQ